MNRRRWPDGGPRPRITVDRAVLDAAAALERPRDPWALGVLVVDPDDYLDARDSFPLPLMASERAGLVVALGRQVYVCKGAAEAVAILTAWWPERYI